MAKMKVQRPDVDFLKCLVSTTLTVRAKDLDISKYVASGCGARQFRWDTIWLMPRVERADFFRRVYGYGCNDDHIDTALRVVMSELDVQWAAQK